MEPLLSALYQGYQGVMVVMMGQSLSGKTTLSQALAERWGDDVYLQEFGDELKAAASSAQQENLNQGNLASDDFVSEVFVKSFVQNFVHPQKTAIIMNGYGRKITQARHIVNFADIYRFRLIVIHLDVSDEVCRARIEADKETRLDRLGDSLDRKLAWFHDEVQPALVYLQECKNIFIRINNYDGTKTKEQVFQEAITALEKEVQSRA